MEIFNVIRYWGKFEMGFNGF